MLNFFKKIIGKLNFLKDRYIYFKKLNMGEIVWARMPLSKKNMKSIETTHQTRPYLIVKKSKFFIYCFQSSSKAWSKAYNYQEYKINKFRYNIRKDSFITLRKVYKIPFWNIKTIYVSLDDIDLKNIEKRLEILECKFKFKIKYKFDDGDIVKIKNQNYYIYASDNTNIYCLIVYPNKPSNQYEKIKVDNRTYFTKFEKKMTFNRKENMQIVNIAFGDEREKIKKQMREYKIKKIKNA